MRNRTIKKQIWLNQTEDNLLKEKSKKANISEAEFLRNCINGFEVQEKPDENFYYVLRDLRGIATNINQLARNANRYGYYSDAEKYKKDFQKQKYPPKYSKAMQDAIKKMDDYSNSARFLAKHNITTLTEIKEYKSSATNKIVELKGLRENLWRKHKKIKTFEEGQLICSEIQKLATKIDELSKDIKLCDFIENNTLRMKDNIKEMSKEENNKVKVKNRYER